MAWQRRGDWQGIFGRFGVGDIGLRAGGRFWRGDGAVGAGKKQKEKMGDGGGRC